MIAGNNYSHNHMTSRRLFSSHPSDQQKDIQCPDYQTGNLLMADMDRENLLNHFL